MSSPTVLILPANQPITLVYYYPNTLPASVDVPGLSTIALQGVSTVTQYSVDPITGVIGSTGSTPTVLFFQAVNPEYLTQNGQSSPPVSQPNPAGQNNSLSNPYYGFTGIINPISLGVNATSAFGFIVPFVISGASYIPNPNSYGVYSFYMDTTSALWFYDITLSSPSFTIPIPWYVTDPTDIYNNTLGTINTRFYDQSGLTFQVQSINTLQSSNDIIPYLNDFCGRFETALPSTNVYIGNGSNLGLNNVNIDDFVLTPNGLIFQCSYAAPSISDWILAPTNGTAVFRATRDFVSSPGNEVSNILLISNGTITPFNLSNQLTDAISTKFTSLGLDPTDNVNSLLEDSVQVYYIVVQSNSDITSVLFVPQPPQFVSTITTTNAEFLVTYENGQGWYYNPSTLNTASATVIFTFWFGGTKRTLIYVFRSSAASYVQAQTGAVNSIAFTAQQMTADSGLLLGPWTNYTPSNSQIFDGNVVTPIVPGRYEQSVIINYEFINPQNTNPNVVPTITLNSAPYAGVFAVTSASITGIIPGTLYLTTISGTTFVVYNVSQPTTSPYTGSESNVIYDSTAGTVTVNNAGNNTEYVYTVQSPAVATITANDPLTNGVTFAFGNILEYINGPSTTFYFLGNSSSPGLNTNVLSQPFPVLTINENGSSSQQPNQRGQVVLDYSTDFENSPQTLYYLQLDPDEVGLQIQLGQSTNGASVSFIPSYWNVLNL